MDIEILTTCGCHLCETAEGMLARAVPEARCHRVDIAEDDSLIDAYALRIPVLRYQGRELEWPFSLLDIRAFVQS